MKKVNISEASYKKLVKEISYGVPDRAYDRSSDLFNDVRQSFEDFYSTLNQVMYDVEFNSAEGEQTSNPYLEKIKELSEPIYDILVRKRDQQDRFFDATTGSVDHRKFYDSSDAEENDINDMDLSYLQNKYPR